MTFDEIWDGVSLGAIITVSNGKPAPSGGLGTPRYNLWRSHNFSGPLLEKIDGAPRKLRIRDQSNPYQVAYDVSEGVEHSFAVE